MIPGICPYQVGIGRSRGLIVRIKEGFGLVLELVMALSRGLIVRIREGFGLVLELVMALSRGLIVRIREGFGLVLELVMALSSYINALIPYYITLIVFHWLTSGV